jgi:iron complex outermembrane receptor protein
MRGWAKWSFCGSEKWGVDAFGPAVRTTASIAALVVGMTAAVGQAKANDQPAIQSRDATPSSESQVQDKGDVGNEPIVVTGTRLSGFTAPTPLTVIGVEAIHERATLNISELIADVPQLAANQNTQQISSPTGASNLDLRALGALRTLVLIDGRRIGATAPNGEIDINTFPTALIKRIDIVTGGASAAYGSDAVAGVVNITLDDKFTGLKGSAQYGETKYDDFHRFGISLTGGTGFADRGHIVVSGEYYANHGQDNQGARPWGRLGYNLQANPGGTPSQLLVANTKFSQMNPGGVTALNSIPALRGIQFGPGGTVLPFTYGTAVDSTYMVGGDGGDFATTANLLPVIKRGLVFGRVGYEFSDAISAYVEGQYSQTKIQSDITPNYDIGTLTIRRDNAFLPKQIRDIMIANNITTFRMGRQHIEEGEPQYYIDTQVQRYAAGFKGSLGGGWDWDAYAQLSRTHYSSDATLQRIQSRWFEAVDSVISPASGQPVCRSTLTNSNNGCIPANVFGPGSLSQAAINWYTAMATRDSHIKQDVYGANVRGDLFSLPAGAVAAAFGVEYRRESVSTVVDALSAARAFRIGNTQPLNGRYNVKEAFAEIVIQVFDTLDLNLAGRVTDYSKSGTVVTYKGGVNFTPFDALRLRATYSRDIRAPNVNELFSSNQSTKSNLIDPVTGNNIQADALTGGNPGLTPEKADSFTAGLVFEPAWLPRTQFSVDYYHIRLKDAISALEAQEVVNGCYILNRQSLCDVITRDPTTNFITAVSTTLINVATVETSGIDFEAASSIPVGGGTIKLHALLSYIFNLDTTINDVVSDKAGEVGITGGIPHWKANLRISYELEPIRFGATLRHVAGGNYSNALVEGVGINDNSVGAQTLVDLHGSYDLKKGVQFFARIDNLFDVDPPLTPGSGPQMIAALQPHYERMGRNYTAGIRFAF